ncbi:class I SAM-dependent methyltransferase [Priestia taiwanensis]|uniref:Methyltransferase n=1 Tax=Priestia taiwanensis TaxID=1347902 RepID=A0A917AWQ8_9BACI|nr:class I SAM-dependent methyltransferase [Priestia taiwanensis]MBM7364767.1 tRNA (cmo5U34)-methyltransferase [Priestia taiwanensis]GGE79459.1 methyltransferase [Priestia taiwanensis]
MKKEQVTTSTPAHTYEQKTRISVPSYDALFSMIQSYFRMQLQKSSSSILIVGAGGGNELSAWGPPNPTWTFTGVDPSEQMLTLARNKAIELELENRVTLIEGTIDNLSYPPATFDAASCILVLHFIHDYEEKRKLLKKIREHVQPGAPFVLVSAYGDRNDPELEQRANIWKSFLIDGGFDAEEMNARMKISLEKLSLLSEREMKQLLEEAGFIHVTKFYATGIFGGWICHAT